MPAILTYVRHGQGLHNIDPESQDSIDPSLTPWGQEQCLSLRQRCFESGPSVSLVLASPLLRTLQTAVLAFSPALANVKCQSNILALPFLQETFDYPFNTGSEPELLRRLCDKNEWPVDMSLVEDEWTSKDSQSRYYPSSYRVEARAREARHFIRERFRQLSLSNDSPHIVLVSHGSFLHYLSNDWENATKYNGTGWDNCESRSYVFKNGIYSNDYSAELLETEKSRRGRKIASGIPSKEVQDKLFCEAVTGWASQGLPNALRLNCIS